MNDVSDSCIQWQHACASTSLCTLKITLWICCCVVLSLTKIKAACSTSSPEECCIFSLMQWQSHTVDNVFQNNIPEGYTGRKRSLDCADWGLAWKASKLRKRGWRRRKKNQTHLKVVACGLLCISVCLFGAAFLSFCLLLFVPSPHFSGLRSYCCPNNPSSRKKKGEKRGSKGWGRGGGG